MNLANFLSKTSISSLTDHSAGWWGFCINYPKLDGLDLDNLNKRYIFASRKFRDGKSVTENPPQI